MEKKTNQIQKNTRKGKRSSEKIDGQTKANKKLQIIEQFHTSKWGQREIKNYIKFMKDNAKTYKDPSLRRKTKFFERMSKKIDTRTPNQCKSHHQKLLSRHGDNFMIFIEDLENSLKEAMIRDENNEINQKECQQCSKTQTNANSQGLNSEQSMYSLGDFLLQIESPLPNLPLLKRQTSYSIKQNIDFSVLVSNNSFRIDCQIENDFFFPTNINQTFEF